MMCKSANIWYVSGFLSSCTSPNCYPPLHDDAFCVPTNGGRASSAHLLAILSSTSSVLGDSKQIIFFARGNEIILSHSC